jgi:hypothetical protein
VLALAAILALAVCLRAPRVGHGLPYLRHPDEARYVKIAHRMFRSGDPNPSFFRIPSLLIYANAATYYPYELARRLGGRVAPTLPPRVITTAVGYAPHSTLFVLGRSLTLAASLLSVIFAFRMTRSLGGAGAGLMAASIVAVSPAAVAHGSTVTPDTLVMLFATICVLASLQVLDTGRPGDYVLSAAGAGLATASKYNGAFFILCPMAAHIMRRGPRRGRWAWLVGLPIIACLFFLVTNPFAVVSHRQFFHDVTAELRHYAAGHPGMEGGDLLWYESALFAALGPAALVAAVSLAAAIRLKERRIVLLWGCSAAYLLFTGCFSVRNVRTLLPVIPLAAALTGWMVVVACRFARKRGESHAAAFTVAVALLVAALITPPLVGSLRQVRELAARDPRDEARRWCEEHLPLGAKIAVESYSVYVNPRRFIVDGHQRIIDNPLEWYRERGYEYVIVSTGSYRRYFRQPERYNQEVSLYQRVFQELPIVASFRNGSPEITIYEVASPDRRERADP